MYVLFVLETGIRSSFEVFDRCRQSRHPWRRSPILYRSETRETLKRNVWNPRKPSIFSETPKKNEGEHGEHGWFLCLMYRMRFIESPWSDNMSIQKKLAFFWRLLQAGDIFFESLRTQETKFSQQRNRGTTIMDYSFPTIMVQWSSTSLIWRPFTHLPLWKAMNSTEPWIFWRKSLPSTTLPKTTSSNLKINIDMIYIFPEVKTRCEF